jgi:hypothetical protein
MIQSIPVDPRNDRAAWLTLRKQDVTASVVTATRGLNPWTSKLALYREKTGHEPDWTSSSVMEWGLFLEDKVAEAVTKFKRPDWTITPAGVYLRDPDLRIGATPDFFIDGDPRGRGVLQTKLVTRGKIFENAWCDEDGNVDAPEFIKVQTWTEMMMAEVSWGAIAALVLDPGLRVEDAIHVFELSRNLAAEQVIKSDVAQFWSDVEWGIEPSADAKLDARLFGLLYPTTDEDKRVDLTGDNYFPVVLAELEEIKARLKADGARREEIETELKFKMADAEFATIDGFVATLKQQSRPKMVADHSLPRTVSRVLRVKDLRIKETLDGQHAGF